jgi:ketosteroid isomerase-like protein
MKDRILAAIAAFGEGSVQPFLDMLAPDATYRVIGTTAVSGTYRGIDQLMSRLFVPLGTELATPIRLEVRAATSAGDRLFVQGEGTARLRSGAPYDNTYCFAFRWSGDRVVEVTEYLDTALVARAFGVPSEPAALLRAMDLNMWEMMREVDRRARGTEMRETNALTMAALPRGDAFHNKVLVRDTVDADTLVREVDAFYGPRGLRCSLWLRDHADGALPAALETRGFKEWLSLPAMALLGDPGTRCEPDGLRIRRTGDDAGRRGFAHVTAEAYATYGSPREVVGDMFATLESLSAPHIQGFVGWVGDEPVAAAAVYVTHGVAGIDWVGTVGEHRGKRYAEAVTWAAIREGFRRGAAFANLQASPMGRPVYERMGFITPSRYRLFTRPQP